MGCLLAVAQRKFVLLRSGGRGLPQLGGRKVGCGGCQQREGAATNVDVNLQARRMLHQRMRQREDRGTLSVNESSGLSAEYLRTSL